MRRSVRIDFSLTGGRKECALAVKKYNILRRSLRKLSCPSNDDEWDLACQAIVPAMIEEYLKNLRDLKMGRRTAAQTRREQGLAFLYGAQWAQLDDELLQRDSATPNIRPRTDRDRALQIAKQWSRTKEGMTATYANGRKVFDGEFRPQVGRRLHPVVQVIARFLKARDERK